MNVQVNLQIRGKKDHFPDNALDYLNQPTHMKQKNPLYISSV